MEFTRGSLTLPGYMPGAPSTTCDAWMHGAFAINKFSGRWRITHVPSMLGIRDLDSHTLAHARRRLAALLELPDMNWSATDPLAAAQAARGDGARWLYDQVKRIALEVR